MTSDDPRVDNDTQIGNRSISEQGVVANQMIEQAYADGLRRRVDCVSNPVARTLRRRLLLAASRLGKPITINVRRHESVQGLYVLWYQAKTEPREREN